jgi:acyl-CoA thioester hydrolase
VADKANTTRADYRYVTPIQTRWMDNDVYAHVNNVVYYSFFDTVVNGYLVAQNALDIEKSDVIGLVVETQCRYFKPIAFPDTLDGALRVAKIGNSSVRYELAIFKEREDAPAAEGHFVHVYVDRKSRRPAALPAPLRQALEKLAAS